MAPLAGGAHEPGDPDAPGPGSAALVLVDQRGVDAGGDRRRARARSSRASASISASAVGERGVDPLELGREHGPRPLELDDHRASSGSRCSISSSSRFSSSRWCRGAARRRPASPASSFGDAISPEYILRLDLGGLVRQRARFVVERLLLDAPPRRGRRARVADRRLERGGVGLGRRATPPAREACRGGGGAGRARRRAPGGRRGRRAPWSSVPVGWPGVSGRSGRRRRRPPGVVGVGVGGRARVGCLRRRVAGRRRSASCHDRRRGSRPRRSGRTRAGIGQPTSGCPSRALAHERREDRGRRIATEAGAADWPRAVAEPHRGRELRRVGADEPRVGAVVGGAGLAEDRRGRRRCAVGAGATGDDAAQHVLLAVGDVGVEHLVARGAVSSKSTLPSGPTTFCTTYGVWCTPPLAIVAITVAISSGVASTIPSGSVEELRCVAGLLGHAHLVGHVDDLVLADAGGEAHERAVHRARGRTTRDPRPALAGLGVDRRHVAEALHPARARCRRPVVRASTRSPARWRG